MSTGFGYHRYDDLLYQHIGGRVYEVPVPRPVLLGESFDALSGCDLFHLHWPELLMPADLAQHTTLISALECRRIPIVWTQHNLVPHRRPESFSGIYSAWAQAADAVVHHSEWGRCRALGTYPYRSTAMHQTIPHGHFGPLMTEVDRLDRGELEASMGLKAGALRFGIVGAPRDEKRTVDAMSAFLTSTRDDVELAVFSLRSDELVPDDPRVLGVAYEELPRRLYNRNLALIDVFVMPFDDGAMLTTGTVGDAIGLGRPVLNSGWTFLIETLGAAGICYGADHNDIAACIDELTTEAIDAAAHASVALQDVYSWEGVARRYWELFLQVCHDPAA